MCLSRARNNSEQAYSSGVLMQKIMTFIESVKLELGKVTWPTRKETVATTSVVVMIVFIISLYLGACDIVLSKLMRLILG
jgi:preprotein translocase subunit SecE